MLTRASIPKPHPHAWDTNIAITMDLYTHALGELDRKPPRIGGGLRRAREPPTWAGWSAIGTRRKNRPRQLTYAAANLNLITGAEGGIRTPMRLPSTVFETVASAVPPLRLAPKIIAKRDGGMASRRCGTSRGPSRWVLGGAGLRTRQSSSLPVASGILTARGAPKSIQG